MPSFLDNLWAMSPWAAEPERDAAQAPSLAGSLPPFEPFHLPPPPPPAPWTELPDITYDQEDWFQGMRWPWPEIPSVIPPEKFVGHDMLEDVKKFVNRNLAANATPREKIECFDYANYQLRQAGGRPGGRPSRDERSLQVLINYPEGGELVEEVQVPETIEAVLYIKEVLQQGIPVLIGICLRDYHNRDGTPARPNNVASTWFVEPTNHFVVIVGMGTGAGEPYFQYWDNYFRPDTKAGQDCRLFLRPTLKLERPDGMVVLSEVRRTMTA
jgi:hypothetical protein